MARTISAKSGIITPGRPATVASSRVRFISVTRNTTGASRCDGAEVVEAHHRHGIPIAAGAIVAIEDLLAHTVDRGQKVPPAPGTAQDGQRLEGVHPDHRDRPHHGQGVGNGQTDAGAHETTRPAPDDQAVELLEAHTRFAQNPLEGGKDLAVQLAVRRRVAGGQHGFAAADHQGVTVRRGLDGQRQQASLCLGSAHDSAANRGW